MTKTQREQIVKHGNSLLAIFPNATEREPVALCKKLRRLETVAHAIGLQMCNGPEMAEDEADQRTDAVLAKVNKLLGNVREYQPKTGAKCSCKPGVQRDNCPACEGTGQVIDFAKIRNRKPLVPIFVNRDPRGYALKIDSEWMDANIFRVKKGQTSGDIPVSLLHRDWGGYGILAPEIDGK